MKYPIRIFAFACLILATSGCEKKVTHTPINPGLYNGYSFKPGSYWIYKDSLTGNEEKFTVTGYNPSKDYNDDDTHTWDDLSIDIKQTNLNNSETSDWNYILTGNRMDLYHQHYTSGIRFYNGGSANYPFNQNIPTLTLNGKTYERVALLKTVTGTPYKNEIFFYAKDSIGFVKIDLNIDTTHHIYELQRYNIVY